MKSCVFVDVVYLLLLLLFGWLVGFVVVVVVFVVVVVVVLLICLFYSVLFCLFISGLVWRLWCLFLNWCSVIFEEDLLSPIFHISACHNS